MTSGSLAGMFVVRVAAVPPSAAPPPAQLPAPAPVIQMAAPPVMPAPGLHLDDMWTDINRLASSVAAQYTDKSCVFLHTDELESEAKVALVNVIEKNWMERADSRGEFFRILKTAICNRMRSLIQQFRFTQKRTGIKPPPKHERNLNFESCKPNEISLDDPDSHLQVGEEDCGLHEDDFDTKELIREIKARCNWFERAVFEQMVEPDLDALVMARLAAIRGQKGIETKIDIKHEHIIQAVERSGITREQWDSAVLHIQEVTESLREMNPDQQLYEVAVETLAELFKVQVPKSVPPMIVRRLFTIAARDNWQKVSPDVEQLLDQIGAVAPKFDKDSMRCHGVLYLKGHRICEACGMKISCMARAQNVGLGEITLHPKLLGAKNRRPYVVASASAQSPLVTSSMRDMEIIDYLGRNFKRVTHNGELYFQPQGFNDKEKLLFCVGSSAIPLRLRFCNPNPALRKKLVYHNKGYYVPAVATSEEVIQHIEEHTKCAYA